jgi:hypothetical protein
VKFNPAKRQITFDLGDDAEVLNRIDRPSFHDDVDAFNENAKRIARILNRACGTEAFRYVETPHGGFHFSYEVVAECADDDEFHRVKQALEARFGHDTSAQERADRTMLLLGQLILRADTVQAVGARLESGEKALIARLAAALKKSGKAFTLRTYVPEGGKAQGYDDVSGLAVRMPMTVLKTFSEAEHLQVIGILNRVTGSTFAATPSSQGEVLQVRFDVPQAFDAGYNLGSIGVAAEPAGAVFNALQSLGLPVDLSAKESKLLTDYGFRAGQSPAG